MKINVFKNREEGKFLISHYDDIHGFGMAFTLDVEDFKTLCEKINAELEDFQKSNT